MCHLCPGAYEWISGWEKDLDFFPRCYKKEKTFFIWLTAHLSGRIEYVHISGCRSPTVHPVRLSVRPTVATPGSRRECQRVKAAGTGKGAIVMVSVLFIPANSGKECSGAVSTCVWHYCDMPSLEREWECQRAKKPARSQTSGETKKHIYTTLQELGVRFEKIYHITIKYTRSSPLCPVLVLITCVPSL